MDLIPQRIGLLGAHPTSGYSMRRYSGLLERGWREAGMVVHRLTQPSILSDRVNHLGLRKWIGYIEKFVLSYLRLRRLCRSIDVIHIADHSDAIYALMLPRTLPILITCHDLFAVRAALGELPEHRPGLTGRLYQWLVRRGLSRAALVLCVTEATARDVERLIARPTATLHNPLDPEFCRSRSSFRNRSSAHPFLLLVANSGWRKRREASLRAWLRLRETEHFHGAGLRVVGPALTVQELTAVPEDCRGAITFEQGVSQPRLEELYAQSAAVLVLSRYEGFGWPVLEAQFAGAPVLAADIPPLLEVGGTGAAYLHVEDLDVLDHDAWDAISGRLASAEVASEASANLERFAFSEFVSRLERCVSMVNAGPHRPIAARQ